MLNVVAIEDQNQNPSMLIGNPSILHFSKTSSFSKYPNFGLLEL